MSSHEALHVDEHVVLDLDAEHARRGIHHRFDARRAALVHGVGVHLGRVRLDLGVDRVDVADVDLAVGVPVRVLRGHRRAFGERNTLEVARQSEDRGLARLGLDAHDRDAVGTQSVAIGPGVAAEQQDVVAPVDRLGDLATREDLVDRRARDSGDHHGVRSGARDGHHRDDREARDEAARLRRDLDDAHQAQRVEGQDDPQPEVEHPDGLHDPEHEVVGRDRDERGLRREVEHRDDDHERPQQERGANAEPTEPAVARDELR